MVVVAGHALGHESERQAVPLGLEHRQRVLKLAAPDVRQVLGLDAGQIDDGFLGVAPIALVEVSHGYHPRPRALGVRC